MSDALPALKKLVADFSFEDVLGCTYLGESRYADEFRRLGKRWHALEMQWQEPAKHAVFDCIWVSDCLERHRSPVEALSRFCAVLRPGGVIAVSVPGVHNEVRTGELHLYTAGHLLQQMVLAGFDCSEAIVRTFGPTVSVIVRKPSVAGSSLDARREIRTFEDLKPYLPAELRNEGFNGRIDSIGWRCLTLYSQHVADFTDTAKGEEIILCGGHPSIVKQAATINELKIPKAVMNNTATIIRPDIWLGMDRPARYEPAILLEPGPLKIGRLNYPAELVAGRTWKSLPNTWFVSDVKNKQEGDWLNEGALIWFKDTFKVAIQILYRMGYRKIYLAGCGFNQPGYYAYGADPEVEQKNARLYGQSVEWLRLNLPYFRQNGLELVNCTPGSSADFLPWGELSALKR